MKDKAEMAAEIIVKTINELRSQEFNEVEIAIDLLSSALPVMIDAAGHRSTANFLHNLARTVEQSDHNGLN